MELTPMLEIELISTEPEMTQRLTISNVTLDGEKLDFTKSVGVFVESVQETRDDVFVTYTEQAFRAATVGRFRGHAVHPSMEAPQRHPWHSGSAKPTHRHVTPIYRCRPFALRDDRAINRKCAQNLLADQLLKDTDGVNWT